MIPSVQQIVHRLQEQVFDSIVSNRLVYNTCWEDPRIDRKLLKIDSGSRIAMLTSAGCNALDYLLDDPRRIDCVDVNPAQNALLELKRALFRRNAPGMLWDFFGEGGCASAPLRYRRELRGLLPGPAAAYWDRHIDYFDRTSEGDSFYFRGTSGKVASLFRRRIRRKGLYPSVLRLVDASSLEEQAYYFHEVEPQLWNAFYRWLMQRDGTLALLGVPRSQRRMIEKEGGLLPFIRCSLRQVFTRLPLSDNYFWRVYLTGSYSRECAPNYLREDHFESIRQRAGRITTHTGTLTRFLQRNRTQYSHFVLLDHMDWMAHSGGGQLPAAWRQILDRSRPGTRILFRTAAPDAAFLPGEIRERVELRSFGPGSLHSDDRVGTYGSTHLAVVRS